MSDASLRGLRRLAALEYDELPTTSATRRSACAVDAVTSVSAKLARIIKRVNIVISLPSPASIGSHEPR
jgi:hypothetical protein